MSLQYIKLTDIYKIIIYDIDSILTENNTFLKTHSIHYYQDTLIKNLSKKNLINILISNNEDFLNIRSKFKQLLNINFYIYIDTQNKYFKYIDNINNIYVKKFYKVKSDILTYIINNIYINCKIYTENNKFILPIGLLNNITFKLKFNEKYFLLTEANKNMKIKLNNEEKSTTEVQTNLVKIRPNKTGLFENLKYDFNKFQKYFETLINLDNKYLLDSWFLSKYINILKSTFKFNDKLNITICKLTKLIKLNALEKKSSNIIYKNYKLFIKYNDYYNFFVSDLYKFKSLCKNLKDVTKKISLLEYESYSEEKLNKINEFFTSKISYSNFTESLEEGTILGTLINGNFKRSCIEGLEPHIFIKNLNTCIITYEDYIENSKYYFDKYNLFDNGYRMKNMIDYDGIGKGNIFLPLYISKNHYNLTKQYLQIVTGMNIYNNPIRFNKKNLLIYVNILTKFIYNSFCNKDYNSDTWYNILINYIIFVNNIIRENFTKEELLELFKNNLHKVKFNKNFVIGLYVLLKLNNFITDDIISKTDISKKILEEELRLLCSKKITNINEFVIKCTNLSINNYYKFLENNLDIDNLIKTQFNNEFLKDKNSFHLDFVKSIYSFNKFLDIFDNKYQEISNDINENHGILSNDKLKFIKENINKNLFVDENDEISGFVNPLFDGHLIMNKIIVINIQNIFTKLNINITDKELYAILIQGMLQRNYNKRKLALKNNNYINPYIQTNECILNCLKIFIKIWYNNNKNRLQTKLLKTFSITKTFTIIYGILYLVQDSLSEFVINVIQNEQTTNIKLKLEILSKYRFIPEKYMWLLPKEEYHLVLKARPLK